VVVEIKEYKFFTVLRSSSTRATTYVGGEENGTGRKVTFVHFWSLLSLLVTVTLAYISVPCSFAFCAVLPRIFCSRVLYDSPSCSAKQERNANSRGAPPFDWDNPQNVWNPDLTL
jgi:hypothetical protein